MKDSKKKDLWWLALSVGLTAVFFFDGSLDIAAAKLFYRPEFSHPWPFENHWFWQFFYYLAPALTAGILLGCVGLLFASLLSSQGQPLSQSQLFSQWQPQWLPARKQILFIFLSIALGPGLVINSVFKPYWGRPRPRQVQELGGQYIHTPFWKKGVTAQGKSFPCGHSSIGFSLVVFWFIWRKSRPKAARAAMVTSVVAGGLLGAGRMAAGGHFLSDVLFSAYIPFGISWLLWNQFFKPELAAREHSFLKRSWKLSRRTNLVIYSLLGFGSLVALLFASPFYKNIRVEWPSSSTRRAKIFIDYGDVQLNLKSSPSKFSLIGEIKGFGLPNNSVVESFDEKNQELHYRVEKQGIFTDYEAVYTIEIIGAEWDNLEVVLGQGTLVTDTPLPPSVQVFVRKGEVKQK